VGFRVYLGWRDDAAVRALAQAVSDPNSPSYGHYLSPAQFRTRFGPSDSSVGAVKSWLVSQGFKIVYTPANPPSVSAEGTIAQAASAFDTSINMYRVNGLVVRSQATAVSIPSSLAGIVNGVIGLDDSAQFVHTDHRAPDAPPAPAFVTGVP